MLERSTSDHLITCIPAHNGWVTSIKYLPNQRNFLTGSADNTIKIWDYDNASKSYTSQYLSTLRHKDKVKSIVYISSLRQVVSASNDRTIKFWNLDTRKLVYTINAAHAGNINQIELAKNERILVSASDDGQVKIWDVRTKKFLFKFLFRIWAWKICFLSDGNHFLTSGGRNSIHLWHIGKKELLKKFLPIDTKDHYTKGIAVKKDDSFFTGSSDHYVRYYVKTNFKPVKESGDLNNVISTILLAKNEETLYVGFENGDLSIVNTKDLAVIVLIKQAHEDRIYELAVDPLSSFLMTCSDQGMLGIWNFEDMPKPKFEQDKHNKKVIELEKESK